MLEGGEREHSIELRKHDSKQILLCAGVELLVVVVWSVVVWWGGGDVVVWSGVVCW